MDLISLAEMHNRPEDPYLPPGFRFHPTDEELVYYLTRKVLFNSFRISAITEVDLNKCEPWDLPAKAAMGEKEWYFYTLRDRKYPTGMRTNRATEAGYWKATGKDRNVVSSRSSCLVGMKKTLVFYRGRAPKGVKSNWIMHEYRLEGEASHLNRNMKMAKDSEWVICRIFQKVPGGKKARESGNKESQYSSSEAHASLPPLMEESPRVTLTEEGAADSSETSQNDQVLSFSETSYSVLKEQNSTTWVPREAPATATDAMLQHTAAPDINFFRVPSYFTAQLGNLHGLDSFSYSSKFRQEFALQQQPAAPVSCDITSLKALDQFSRALAGPYSIAKPGIRACKVEPKTPVRQSNFRPLDTNEAGWLNVNQSLSYCNPQLPLQQNFVAQSQSISEAAAGGEVPSNLYRAVPSSSSVDIETLWSY